MLEYQKSHRRRTALGLGDRVGVGCVELHSLLQDLMSPFDLLSDADLPVISSMESVKSTFMTRLAATAK
jgi:hypothetical protein